MKNRLLSNDHFNVNSTNPEDSFHPTAGPSPKKNSFSKSLLLCCLSLLIAFFIFIAGIMRMKKAYDTAVQNTYDEFYQTAFDFAEKQNHVSNYAIISVENIQEISRLEVLTVSDCEFVIKNADEESSTVAWLEVQGTGVFTVDLSASEFITDSERKNVLVRIPKPALTECTVSEADDRFWKDGSIFFNGSTAEGVQLAQAQMREGRIMVENAIRQNRTFNDAAKKSAVYMIQSLVQQWNPTIPDLQVEVEFIEDF